MALIGPLCPCNNWPDRGGSISFHPVRRAWRWGKCSTDDKMSILLIRTSWMDWKKGGFEDWDNQWCPLHSSLPAEGYLPFGEAFLIQDPLSVEFCPCRTGECHVWSKVMKRNNCSHLFLMVVLRNLPNKLDMKSLKVGVCLASWRVDAGVCYLLFPMLRLTPVAVHDNFFLTCKTIHDMPLLPIPYLFNSHRLTQYLHVVTVWHLVSSESH